MNLRVGAAHLLLGPALLLLGNCKATGDARVSFEHAGATPQTIRQALTATGGGETPDVFGVKLIAMYLVEDVDATSDNVGDVARIWTNPGCDENLHRCSITSYGGDHQIKDYFDLSLPSEQVNANLNSQPKTINAHTYRYLRMDMAGVQIPPDQTVPNLRFGKQGESSSEIRFENNYNVRLDPPMEIGEGDSVMVTLGYDLVGVYYGGPMLRYGQPPEGVAQNDWRCADPTKPLDSGPCIAFKGFTPRATKVTAPAAAVDAGD